MDFNVIAFSGSLRKDSFTTRMVHAFKKCAPQTVNLELIRIDDLPFINQDLETNLPEPVKNLHTKIENADAVLFATPEYNRSYSPVLKNAIDWGSRPEGENKWAKKPVAIIGCTPYLLGAFGAQNHLRQVIMYLDMIPLQQPEFYLGSVDKAINEQSEVTDKETLKKINELWAAFIELIKQSKK